MMTKFAFWLEQTYDLGRVSSIQKLQSGMMSEALKVNCKRGTFVLRQLKSTTQGEVEYALATALSEEGLCPQIVRTRLGLPFAMHHGTCFNLQKYYESTPPSLNAEQCTLLGETVGQCHQVLKGIGHVGENPDQFSTFPLYKKFPIPKILLHYGWDEKAIRALHDALMAETQQYIHADLGLYNMLFVNEKWMVIDFGEARYGSPYFDVAAVLASIEQLSSKECFKEHSQCFLKAYGETTKPLNFKLVFQATALWTLRGLFAYADAVDDVEKVEKITHKMLTLLERIEVAICG